MTSRQALGIRILSSIILVWGTQNWIPAQNMQSFPGMGRGPAGSVDIEGNLMVTGEPETSLVVENQGAVSIFRRSGNQWLLEETLTAEVPVAREGFGSAVAIEGEYLAVGAPGLDYADNLFGAVYIFRQSEGNWALEQRIERSEKTANDRFGRSLALDGGLLVVGSPLASDDESYAGAAYVFTSSAGIWQEQAQLIAPEIFPDSQFGTVDVYRGRIAVGAPGEPVPVPGVGAVHIFDFISNHWVRTKHLTGNASSFSAVFGERLSLDNNRLAVGFMTERFVHEIQVYDWNGSQWSLTQALTAPWTERLDTDLDLKGDHLLVGGSLGFPAPIPNSPAGGAYLFHRSGSQWQLAGYVPNPDPVQGDEFGAAVSLDTNLGMVIAAPKKHAKPGFPSPPRGSAYFYEPLLEFGSGCPPSDGQISMSAVNGYPGLGSSLSIQLQGLPANAACVGITGRSTQSWAGIPLPLNLAVLGMPGCVLRMSLDRLSSFQANQGQALWEVDIPTNESLIGQPLYLQVVYSDPGANAAGLKLSQALRTEVMQTY